MDTDPRLSAHQLGKSYDDLVVLGAVTVDIDSSTVVAVTGSNGAGKSTFLGCLAGVISHQGQVLIDGKPRMAGSVVYLPQRVQFPSNVFVGEVLDLFGGEVALPDGFIPERRRRISELSGGQRRRVAVAAALGSEAGVVLLDEPLANLDDQGRTEVVEILAGLRERGAAVVIASPTVVDLLTIVDRVLVIDGGKLVFDGPAAHYFAGIKTGIWVRGHLPPVVADLAVDPRTAGDWHVFTCREDEAAELVSTLIDRGVLPSDIRLGGPDEGAQPSFRNGTS